MNFLDVVFSLHAGGGKTTVSTANRKVQGSK